MKGLLLTYLLGYGGAVVGLFQPVIALFIYVLFSIIRPQLIFGWAGNLQGMSLYVGIALLIGWGLRGFGNWRLGRATTVVTLLIAYFIWYCLSAAAAADQGLAWMLTLQRAKVVLPFLVGVTMLDSPLLVRRFLWLFVLAHGYLGFEMNLNYLQGYNKAADGLLGDNNSFAISMVTAVGPAIFLGLAAERWWQKALAFGSAALILHTVLLTYSRGGMLSLLITGVVVLIVMPKRTVNLVALAVAVAIAVRFTGPELEARFKTTFAAPEHRDFSEKSRLELWQDCLTVMARHPVLGVGPGHFPKVAWEFGWSAGKEAHTTWLQAGAETGVPSLVFLFSFYLLAALWGLRAARRHPNAETGMFGMCVFSGLTGYMIAAQFVSIEGLEVPYYLALVAAACMKLPRPVPDPVQETGAPNAWERQSTSFGAVP